jgi:hypothetical protein
MLTNISNRIVLGKANKPIDLLAEHAIFPQVSLGIRVETFSDGYVI